ncbi:MAG TPA: phage holin family protein [Macromonas sp.]|nr:phage holin family protein [Macromonas sp.]
MLDNLTTFALHWAITSLSLWVASFVFKGIRFESTSSLIVAALVLGFVNAVLRPILFVLTLPLSMLTLGLFLLVINALLLMLVSAWVRGFTVSGFWTAFFASIFITLLGMFFGMLLFGGQASWTEPMPMPQPMHPRWL